MSIEQSIREKLTRAFTPISLVVENESAKHAGHAGVTELKPDVTGETHFRVIVVSERFEGQSLVNRHRLVNDVLRSELQGPVHALAIKAMSPSEMMSPFEASA